MTTPSFVEVIDRCDNFRVTASDERLYPLLLRPPSQEKQFPLGFLRPDILGLISEEDGWLIEPDGSGVSGFVSFPESVDSPEKRSGLLEQLVKKWISQGQFTEQTGGRLWRNELYNVYKNPFGDRMDPDNLALRIERTAAALFGFVTYGVHLTMYLENHPDATPANHSTVAGYAPRPDSLYMIWVPTRSKSKQTWGGYLDNTVAGGIPAGMSPLEAIIKECQEEANLDPSLVLEHIKAVGSVSYMNRTPAGWLQPEVQFIYDLRIPSEFQEQLHPKPFDGEVESFKLCSIDECISTILDQKWKPNCALVLIDFLIRHGFLEEDPNALDIQTRIHGRFGYENVY